MLSEAADNSALEACPDSVQFPGSIRWGAAHFFEPIISLRPCLRGELRSMPRTTCPSGVAYHPGPRTRRTITSPGSRDGSWLPPDHAAGAKLRCLRLLRARFVARFPRQTGRWETTDSRRMFKKLCFRVIANTPSRLVFFPRCRLLSPRQSAKSFSANGMVGRGGGDRTRDPRLVRFHPSERRFGPIDWASGRSMQC